MQTLQHVLLPRIELCTDQDLYLRVRQGAFWTAADGTVQLGRGGTASFDTYFNTFPAGKWQRYSTVGSVALEVDVAGRFEVQAFVDHPHHSRRMVAARSLESDGGPVLLDPVTLAPLAGGQLFWRLRCVGRSGVLHGGRVVTDAEPCRDVRLAVVVTTFRRQAYMRANVERLVDHLRAHPDVAAAVRVLIVDNGGDLRVELPADAPVRVLPNRNLGGAGGFARGLLEVRDAGWATHVLFMDDDISFDPEIVGRTLALLRNAASPELCVSGAMLREEHPELLHEAGAGWASFAVHPWRPIGKNLDLSEEANLPQADLDQPIDYSGWWYFAFPLHLTSDYPFPLFVRGDDVLFSLLHARPHSISVNGIGVWHQDFEYKNNPAAFYYEARNIALVNTLAVDGYAAKHLRKRLVALMFRSLLSMKYDSAEATLRGVTDFLRGPAWWADLDHEALHGELVRGYGERIGELPDHLRRMPFWQPPPAPLQLPRVALALATLGGHLSPPARTRGAPVAVSLQTRPITTGLGRDEIVYRYPATGDGFVVRRDRERFFRLVRATARTCVQLSRRFARVRDDYRAAYPEMVSDASWRRRLGLRAADEPEAESPAAAPWTDGAHAPDGSPTRSRDAAV
jgi:galactofuranosylgalactofuranosylrhamnosyl-N-acetylglucosaminyl-diphospho-decaprenol beta-1,5/1,6-galactofuranosyltransferase